MHEIEMHEVKDEFQQCWNAAVRHIQALAQGAHVSWLRVDLAPPFLDHLSFRLGNQLFFLRLLDVDDNLETPGNLSGLHYITEGCNGRACLMPMKRMPDGWKVYTQGWGLVDASTRQPLDPPSVISSEKIEMTDWELLDFAVQIVRNHIADKLGYDIMSFQSNPSLDPSIWFVGDNGPEWVTVRAVRYPKLEAAMPPNIKNIAKNCIRQGKIGHFASVSVANSEDAFDPDGNIPALPLWRGHGLFPRFEGLLPAILQ